MTRTGKIKSESGIYHIILRGINRQTIFEEDEDAVKFLETLREYQDKSGYNGDKQSQCKLIVLALFYVIIKP